MLAGGFFALILALLVCVVGFFGSRLGAARFAGVAAWAPVFAIDQKPWRDVAFGKRALFAAAGPVGLYLIAVLMIAAGFVMVGENTFDETNMHVHTRPGSAAEAAGIRDGMRIVAIDTVSVNDWDTLRREVGKHPSEEISIHVFDNDDMLMSLRATPDANGKIGVSPVAENHRLGVGSALGKGLVEPFRVSAAIGSSIYRMLAGSEEVEGSGPVGIAQETGRTSQTGFGNLLRLLGALISYFLFVPVILSLVFFPRRSKPGIAAS